MQLVVPYTHINQIAFQQGQQEQTAMIFYYIVLNKLAMHTRFCNAHIANMSKEAEDLLYKPIMICSPKTTLFMRSHNILWKVSLIIRKPHHLMNNVLNAQSLLCHTIWTVPSVLVLALNGEPHMISPHIKIPFNGKMFKLKLRGVIYGGQFHFTSRIISPDGSIWYHDGMTTQSSCSRQGSIHHLSSMNYLRTCVEGDAQKTAVSLIYARK